MFGTSRTTAKSIYRPRPKCGRGNDEKSDRESRPRTRTRSPGKSSVGKTPPPKAMESPRQRSTTSRPHSPNGGPDRRYRPVQPAVTVDGSPLTIASTEWITYDYFRCRSFHKQSWSNLRYSTLSSPCRDHRTASSRRIDQPMNSGPQRTGGPPTLVRFRSSTRTRTGSTGGPRARGRRGPGNPGRGFR